MDFLGLNLIFLLALWSNPIRWEGWVSSLWGPCPHAAACLSQGRWAEAMRSPLATPLEWLGELQLPVSQEQEEWLSKTHKALFWIYGETPHLVYSKWLIFVRFKTYTQHYMHIIPAKLGGNGYNISMQGLCGV